MEGMACLHLIHITEIHGRKKLTRISGPKKPERNKHAQHFSIILLSQTHYPAPF
jgi:hypothetical protein